MMLVGWLAVAWAGEDCREAGCTDAKKAAEQKRVESTVTEEGDVDQVDIDAAALPLCVPGLARCAEDFVVMDVTSMWEPGVPRVTRRAGARAGFWTVKEHRRRRRRGAR